MRETHFRVLSLTISGVVSDLRVVAVQGRDSLNAPYCYKIDLLSCDPALAPLDLLKRSARLTVAIDGSQRQTLHGLVCRAKRRYRGVSASLYQLSLMPALQLLAGNRGRASYNGRTVPQILSDLLLARGLSADDFRFDTLSGHYPPREHCIQLDESDLHLIQRLCAEEGMSFRFEHRADRAVLVFSDDPAVFPECAQAAQVDHIAERFSAHTCYSTHAGELYIPSSGTDDPSPGSADNQPWQPDALPPHASRRGRQLRGRLMERLRSERRQIVGRSTRTWLAAGTVMRVEGQSDPLLNDHFLLKEVSHVAKQWSALDHCLGSDAAQIARLLAADNSIWSSTERDVISYRNTFEAMPWAMPYRPIVERQKPWVDDVQRATQISSDPDIQGRFRIRYDWQTQAQDSGEQDNGEQDSWAHQLSRTVLCSAGALLKIRFFDGDPDQPVICGPWSDSAPTHSTGTRLLIDGVEQAGSKQLIQLLENQTLEVESQSLLWVRSANASLRITQNQIEYIPTDKTSSSNIRGLTDLQLVDQEQRLPLPHRIWYIVRMDTPDLARLPRIDKADILFEGKTDSDGWLGLSSKDRRRLDELYKESAQRLCIVHPGYCWQLQDCFRGMLPGSGTPLRNAQEQAGSVEPGFPNDA